MSEPIGNLLEFVSYRFAEKSTYFSFQIQHLCLPNNAIAVILQLSGIAELMTIGMKIPTKSNQQHPAQKAVLARSISHGPENGIFMFSTVHPAKSLVSHEPTRY